MPMSNHTLVDVFGTRSTIPRMKRSVRLGWDKTLSPSQIESCGEISDRHVDFDSSNSLLTNSHPRFSEGLWKHILPGSSFENLRQPQHWLNKRTLCFSLCSLHSIMAVSNGIELAFDME